jgi:hypothetical protein
LFKWKNLLYIIRITSYSLNGHNIPKRKNASSKFRGVCFNRKQNKYTSYINYEKRYHLGTFETEKEAAEAYNKKAIEFYGKNARLNEID